jgi:hypothetical protein
MRALLHYQEVTYHVNYDDQVSLTRVFTKAWARHASGGSVAAMTFWTGIPLPTIRFDTLVKVR